jgi:predicted SAM-dependent methyltransferase
MNWSTLLDIAKNQPLKLNIGGKNDCDSSGKSNYVGWYSVGLKVRPKGGVNMRFPGRIGLPDCSVDAALSEHFLEHLTGDDARKTMAEIARVLKVGARFRVAVPDMLHPRHIKSYVAQRDLGDRNHLSVWDYRSMSVALMAAGFDRIEPLNHFDELGRFHDRRQPFNVESGFVRRSRFNDRRNFENREYRSLWSSSLVIDAIKLYEDHDVATFNHETLPLWSNGL